MPTSILGLAALLIAPPQEAPDTARAASRGLPLEPTREIAFTTERGSWISVDVSPDGSTLVFDLLGDIYTLPITGGAATPVLTGQAFEAQPRFSPDGTEILFVSDRSGGHNLWILSLDLSDTTQVTRGNDNLYTSPEWVPGGEYIVASRTFSPLGGAAKPWLFHRDGGAGASLITEPENLKLIGAAFGPDPRYIYMAEGTGDWTYDATFPEYQLTRYDRETGQRAAITSRYGSGFRPQVSPDGSVLVYGTRHDDATGLRVRDLETGGERWLAYPVQRDDMESRATLDILPGYAFTPDGEAVVLSNDGHLWRMPLDGSAPTRIPFTVDVKLAVGPRLDFDFPVDDTPTFDVAQIREPALSPDGSSVTFTALGRLYVMPAGGGTPREIGADVGVPLFQPAWSPDGRAVAAVSWTEPEGGHLWSVPVGGGASTRLSPQPRYLRQPAWSPAGDRVVVLQGPVRQRLMGGGAAETDLVWYPATSGAPTRVAPAEGRSAPHFRSGDPARVFLSHGTRGLVSLRWDGTDEKEHLRVTGFTRAAGGTPPNASWINFAPEGDRALVRVENDLYVVTFPQVGAAPPTISVRSLEAAPFPVVKVTEYGGEFPSWSSDGSDVLWSLGNVLFRYDLERAEVVRDSLAEARRAAAGSGAGAADGDSTAAAGAAAGLPADSVAARPAAPDSARYRPAEVRVSISEPRDLPQGTLVLRGARVVTMRGDEVLEGGDVLIEGSRIRAVGATGTITVPPGAEVRDVTGMTILPGFVDTHAHIRPSADIHDTQAWAYLANLAFGVTTTRDPQTGVSDVLTYADLVRSGRMIGPRVYSTGPGIFGSYQGEPIRNLAHARDILRRYAQYYGTQTFKMYLAGNRQQRQWLIMAARELGLMPTTEAGIDFALDLTQALDGYPAIEHNLPVQPLYEDVVTLFAESQVVNTPTLIVNFGGPMGEIYWFTRENVHDHERLRRFTPHEVLDARTRRRAGASGAVGWAVESEFVFEEHARFLRDVVAEGGMTGVGSHGQLQGLGYHWEMWMLASGGMPNHDVLRAATIFGANGIGLERQLGSIEPGKLADLVLLSRNPLDDIRATTSVEQVMVNGRLLDAGTLEETWPRRRALPYKGFIEDEPGR
jgi:imidazolonepropionase-like amidohydrolase/Tol biopolymer transport system component